MEVWHWPSSLRWARGGCVCEGSTAALGFPLPPRPKVSEDQIHSEPDGRGQKVRTMFVLNSPTGFKTTGLERCWITCVDGEHPSPVCRTCPWVRPPCTVCPQREMAFASRSLLPTFSPCCLYHAGGLILLLYAWEGKTASHRHLTQLSQCRSIPASKPNCPTSAQST